MKKERITYCVSIFVLVLLILLVYYPTITHLFRGEMYLYFLDTSKDTSVIDLIVHWYNYDAVRVYSPGDSFLFRPLLWVLVATEKGLFGINYVLWNVVSLVSHILATLSLYQLLWAIKKSFLAMVLAAFFAVSFLLINTILYQQITAYMLFVALVLFAIRFLLEGLQEDGFSRKITYAFFCILIASFLYEIGSVFAVIMAVYVWLKRRSIIMALDFLFIPVFYSVAYILWNPLVVGDVTTFLTGSNILSAMASICQLVLFWLQEVVFPTMYSLLITPILQYNPVAFGMDISVMKYPLIGLNILAVVVIGLALLKREKKDHSLLVYMVGVMLLTHIFIVCFFRASTFGLTYILSTNFTAYMVLAWFILLLYLLLADVNFSDKRYKAVVCALVGLLVVNGCMVYMANRELASVEYASKDFLTRLGDFVAVHQAESDFTFCVTGLPKEFTIDTFRDGEKSGTLHLSIPQTLYASYWNDVSPKYTINYGGVR